MSTEAFITLPPDSTGKSIRLFQVVRLEPDGTWQTEYQEAVTLTDEDGNLLAEGGLGYKSLPVTSQEILERLDSVVALLSALVRVGLATGRPRSELHSVDQALQMAEAGKAA